MWCHRLFYWCFTLAPAAVYSGALSGWLYFWVLTEWRLLLRACPKPGATYQSLSPVHNTTATDGSKSKPEEEKERSVKRSRAAEAVARATAWRRYTTTPFVVLYLAVCFVPAVIIAGICSAAIEVCAPTLPSHTFSACFSASFLWALKR
jgi:hypothetical protein